MPPDDRNPLSEPEYGPFKDGYGPHKLPLLGSRAVLWRRESRLALGLALAVALVLGASLRGPEGAGAGKSARALRQAQASLANRSHSALLSLYALDSRLEQARTELAQLHARVESLRAERRQLQADIEIVGHNLAASRRLLARHLRTLYQHGEPDSLAVLLGAQSLDDAVERLDALELSSRQGTRAIADSRAGRAKLQRLARALEVRVREVEVLELQAERTTSALAAARADRVAYIASLARQRRLNARQIAALDSHARRVVEQTQAAAPTAATAARSARAPTRSP